MTTSTRISFDDYLQLPNDGKRCELNEGELIKLPSPSPLERLLRQRIAMDLMQISTTSDKSNFGNFGTYGNQLNYPITNLPNYPILHFVLHFASQPINASNLLP